MVDNQHRKITGYRELNEEEIALMNEVKALGADIEAVLMKVSAHVESQRAAENVDNPAEQIDQLNRMDNATPERFAAIAKTHFQQGLMAATRAVAQPEFF